MFKDNQLLSYKGKWFGNLQSNANPIEIRKKINSKTNEIEKFSLVIELLKLGDFSAKINLFEFMTHSKNSDIRKISCRVFCSIAQHSDIPHIERFLIDALQKANEDELNTFVFSSIHTLSPEVTPFLLALLEESKSKELEENIRYALHMLFPYKNFLSSDITIKEIGSIFEGKFLDADPEIYYLQGKPVFPGTLTKELLSIAAEARYKKEPLYLTEIPSLLSIWSGIECPAYYYTTVDDDVFRQLLDYVKKLASIQWEKGCKYFYGHKI